MLPVQCWQNVGQVQTFVFKNDGTFTLSTLGVIETKDVGATAEGNKKEHTVLREIQ